MDTENEKKGTEKVNPDYQMTDRAPTSYMLLVYRLTAQGACPKCGRRIEGVWG